MIAIGENALIKDQEKELFSIKNSYFLLIEAVSILMYLCKY